MLESNTIEVKSTATDVLESLVVHGAPSLASILWLLSELIDDVRMAIIESNAFPVLLHRLGNGEDNVRSGPVRAILKLAQYCMSRLSVSSGVFQLVLTALITLLTDETRTQLLRSNMIPLLNNMLRRNDVRVKSTVIYIFIELARYGGHIFSSSLHLLTIRIEDTRVAILGIKAIFSLVNILRSSSNNQLTRTLVGALEIFAQYGE